MDISRIYDVFCQHPLICTDSRKIQKNCIFIALKGESFDGNQYAEDAIELGASYAIVDNPSFVNSEKYILVSNTLETLQQLALFHRKRFNIPVIAITGTNGKTTTKELIATVLAQKYKVLATKGNLNNHIGVPFTLFELNKTHEIAVIELGANHQGEITELCNLALPEYGIITNIGKAHLEGFGSFEGIIKAKTELFDFLRSHSGKVFIIYDDDLLMKHAENLSELTSGSDKNADYRTEIVSNEPFLTLKYFENNNILNIHSQLIGTYNAGNISAAIAVGRYFGIGSKLIKDAISAYIPQNNRSQLIDTGRNQLILDAYNANPSSMEAALNNFIQNPDQPKMFILGEMLELGNYSAEEHKRIIEISLQHQPGLKIFIGGGFYRFKNEHPSALFFLNTQEAKNWLKHNDKIIGYHILIKGSRKNQLESLAENL